MTHAHHFLSRLDRVDLPHVELAPSNGTFRLIHVHQNVPGVLRDILCNDVPLLFRSELYASVLGWVTDGRRPRLASLMTG